MRRVQQGGIHSVVKRKSDLEGTRSGIRRSAEEEDGSDKLKVPVNLSGVSIFKFMYDVSRWRLHGTRTTQSQIRRVSFA